MGFLGGCAANVSGKIWGRCSCHRSVGVSPTHGSEAIRFHGGCVWHLIVSPGVLCLCLWMGTQQSRRSNVNLVLFFCSAPIHEQALMHADVQATSEMRAIPNFFIGLI